MSHLASADDIVILSSSYIEMQGLLESVNRHAVGMRINASRTKMMSALIPGEQRQGPAGLVMPQDVPEVS